MELAKNHRETGNASSVVFSHKAGTDAPAQDTKEVNEPFCSKSSSCFHEIWKNICDKRPPLTGEEDEEELFWRNRGECGRQQLLTPLCALFFILFDVGMDFKVAVTHFMQGHYNWGAYTVGVVIFSLVIIEALSASFYISDQRDLNKTYWLAQNSLQVKNWFYGLHFVFCGRILRCSLIFRTVRRIRRIQGHQSDNQIQLYRLYISQQRQLSILGVVEAFTEQAPQIALQLHILLAKHNFDWTSDDIMVAVNMAKSLALFSFSLLNFIRYLRLGNEESKLLELFSLASLLHFFWRLFMLVARILALVLFGSSFKHMVFVIVAIHFLFSFFLLVTQPDKYFAEGSARDKLLRCAFTCINTFCFFPLAGKNTWKWAIPYYLVTFIENSIMVIIWNFHSDFGQGFKTIMLVTEWSAFLLGLVSVLLYYKIFHPSKQNQDNSECCRPVACRTVDEEHNDIVTSTLHFTSTV